MIRLIAGFHQDDDGDWVADLSCLHRQHLRHRPPFQDRAWVIDDLTRQKRVGSAIDCPLCDRAELPDDISLLRSAGPWDEHTLPPGLRRSHRTAEGEWGLLRVIEGGVNCAIETAPPTAVTLVAGDSQPIPPEVPHLLVLTRSVRLMIEFWGRSK